MKKSKLVLAGLSLFLAFCITTALSATPPPFELPTDDEKENSFPCIGNPDALFIYCTEGSIDCVPKECPQPE